MAELTIEQIKQREYARVVVADTHTEYAAGLAYCALMKSMGVDKTCIFKDRMGLTNAWIEARAVYEFNLRAKWAARRAARAQKG